MRIRERKKTRKKSYYGPYAFDANRRSAALSPETRLFHWAVYEYLLTGTKKGIDIARHFGLPTTAKMKDKLISMSYYFPIYEDDNGDPAIAFEYITDNFPSKPKELLENEK